MKSKYKYRFNEHKKRFLKNKFNHNIKRKIIKKHKKNYSLMNGKIIKTKKIIPPKIFSISKNSVELIKFFKKIQSHCMESKKKLLLDMRKIEKIDVDALMYLKYIVYEIKEKENKNIILSFIPPKSIELKKIIRSSGFIVYKNKNSKYIEQSKKRFSYLEYQNSKSLSNLETENFTIKRGNHVDVITNKKIVDFTKQKKNKFIYTMMSELMENTTIHAYTEEGCGDWYLFAEKDKMKISFIFLDTGLGIPNTVQKRLLEEANPWKSSSKLLLSTLQGDKRTRTKEAHRGKGLPFILKLSLNNSIQNLRIISNKACFNLNENKDIKEELKGTFFYWEIKRKKREEKNEKI